MKIFASTRTGMQNMDKTVTVMRRKTKLHELSASPQSIVYLFRVLIKIWKSCLYPAGNGNRVDDKFKKVLSYAELF